MASYRFCRSDDIALLAGAHNDCYLPHAPGLAPLTVDSFKLAAREIDLWTSSCMVVSEGADPVGVLLACKRERETLIWRIGVHADHLRRGHARHLLTSLSAKLAILGPPRLVAEVPAASAPATALFDACGWSREATHTDFVLRSPAADASPSDLVIPVTVDELIANDAVDVDDATPWDRCAATLVKRKAAVRGLGVASDARIEAYLLYEVREGEPLRLLALRAVGPDGNAMWPPLLLRQLARLHRGPFLFERVAPGERGLAMLAGAGFVPGAATIRYATTAKPG